MLQDALRVLNRILANGGSWWSNCGGSSLYVVQHVVSCFLKLVFFSFSFFLFRASSVRVCSVFSCSFFFSFALVPLVLLFFLILPLPQNTCPICILELSQIVVWYATYLLWLSISSLLGEIQDVGEKFISLLRAFPWKIQNFKMAQLKWDRGSSKIISSSPKKFPHIMHVKNH